MRDGLAARLKARALEQGFALAGIAEVRESDHADFLRDWLAAGYHGDMAYLARPDAVARRADPRAHAGAPPMDAADSHTDAADSHTDAADSHTDAADSHTDAADPGAHAVTHAGDLRSALVVADFYPAGGGEASDRAAADPGAPTPRRRSDDPATAVIARYARGRDYHRVVKGKLRRLLRWLEGEVGRPLPAARACVDTSPVLERELARRAGIGWFGRNTMLIHPRRGSYFFLGVLMTELDLEPDAPFEADHCGTCRACLDACPTGALLGRDANGAPVMDARLCISYLTIEHRGPIPPELRPAIGNRVFGCDICQEVCPFNIRFAQEGTEPGYAARGPGERPAGVEALPEERSRRRDVSAETSGRPHIHPGTATPPLVDLMRMTREGWDLWTRGSAIRRAGYAGFKRNVAVAMGNWLALVDEPPEEALAVLRYALEDEEPLVREHAAWALGQLPNNTSNPACNVV